MSQQTSFDPFTMWKSFYDKTESNWNELINENLQKEAFSEWMGQSLNTYLIYQEFIQKTTENYLKQVNMPTRTEVSNLATLIINLEDKVDQLDQKAEQGLFDQQAVADNAEISKLKNEITKLDRKIDKILKMLQQNEEAAVAVQDAPAAVRVASAEEKK